MFQETLTLKPSHIKYQSAGSRPYCMSKCLYALTAKQNNVICTCGDWSTSGQYRACLSQQTAFTFVECIPSPINCSTRLLLETLGPWRGTKPQHDSKASRRYRGVTESGRRLCEATCPETAALEPLSKANAPSRPPNPIL